MCSHRPARPTLGCLIKQLSLSTALAIWNQQAFDERARLRYRPIRDPKAQLESELPCNAIPMMHPAPPQSPSHHLYYHHPSTNWKDGDRPCVCTRTWEGMARSAPARASHSWGLYENHLAELTYNAADWAALGRGLRLCASNKTPAGGADLKATFPEPPWPGCFGSAGTGLALDNFGAAGTADGEAVRFITWEHCGSLIRHDCQPQRPGSRKPLIWSLTSI